MVEAFLPPMLDSGFALFLVGLSAITSLLTALFGIGGGMVLLVVMAHGLPVAPLLAVHGAVQFGSNTSRALILRKYVHWRYLAWFVIAALAGGFAGGMINLQLPEMLLKLLLAAGVLVMVWFRHLRNWVAQQSGQKTDIAMTQYMPRRRTIMLSGFVSSFASMFVGATGPVVAASIGSQLSGRMVIVSTMAAAMSIQHLVKIVMFALLGFAFAPWVPFICAMIASGYVGTLIGTKLLGRMDERYFAVIFRWLLTLLAINIAYGAMT